MKADELDPNHHPIHAACLGDCLKEQEKWSNAVKLYNIALERSDKNFDGYRADIALCCRGYCLRRLENYDASLADHNRSLKINPNRAETYYQRAWTYRWMGQYNLAKEDYDKAVQLDADYANHEVAGRCAEYWWWVLSGDQDWKVNAVRPMRTTAEATPRPLFH